MHPVPPLDTSRPPASSDLSHPAPTCHHVRSTGESDITDIVDQHRRIESLGDYRSGTLARAIDRDGNRVLLKSPVDELASADAHASLVRQYEIGLIADHPNLATAVAIGGTDMAPIVVFDDDGGARLASTTAAGPLDVVRAVRVAAAIAEGLAHLHRRDVVHRDINPWTVTVTPDGASARIVDFEQATVIPRQQVAVASTRELSGTLQYVSPEQTGRTSRPVDFRTDLYALGILLYELLTGAPPFAEHDGLELVHDHLAVRPPAPSSRRVGVPPVLDRLVATLLEKDPDDRYRSAAGVATDLSTLADAIEHGSGVDSVELVGISRSTRFQLPDRLFGRDEELGELRRWIERPGEGASLVFVHGRSGVGKTSVIGELRSSISRHAGYMAVGKADQLDTSGAAEVFVAACRDLTRSALTEPDEFIERWRQALEELGSGAGVLTDLIPEAAAIIPDAGPVRSLDAERERHRIHHVLATFLTSLADLGRPVVLVLEDLQWADSATLDLVEQLLDEVTAQRLVIIATYRDTDVDQAHPVMRLRRRLSDRGTAYGDVELGPLPDGAATELIADASGRPAAEVAELAEVCAARTGNNPFQLRLFLRGLFETDLIRIDAATSTWTWELTEIRRRPPTENIVDLAVRRLRDAPADVAAMLATMALIGPAGDAALLEEIGLQHVDRSLRDASGLAMVDLSELAGGLAWVFAHDRIQQAAASLVDDDEANEWHARIGEVLHARYRRGDRDTSIFSVLRHLNAGRRDTGPDPALAALNADGARRALASTAYDAALQYATTGIQLLGPDAWRSDGELAFDLHISAANAARLGTDFDAMDTWLSRIETGSDDWRHRAAVARIRIVHLSHVDRNPEAVDAARSALAELGVELPTDPRLVEVVAGLIRTRLALRKWPIAELESLPPMSDPIACTTLSLLDESVSAAYFADPNVMALMIQRAMRLAIEHGNGTESPMFYAAYGMVMAGIVRRPEEGLAYADLAVRLADRIGPESKPGRVRFTRDTLVAPFTTPLVEIEPSLERAYTQGIETGDVGFGTGAHMFLALHRLIAGRHLDTVEQDLEASERLLQRHAQLRNLAAALALRQFVHDVRHGPNGRPFRGPHAVGEEHLRDAQAAGDKMAVFWTLQFRGMSSYHWGDRASARRDLADAGEHLDAVLGQALVPLHHLYCVLASTDPTSRDARRHLKKLGWFARHNPGQWEAAKHLAHGAVALADGRDDAGSRSLLLASEQATARGMPLIAALADSLLADSISDPNEALHWRGRAALAFRSWGANALAEAGEGPARPSAPPFDLDIETVVRTSEAISEQVDIDDLIHTLLQVTAHSAGADHVVLFRVGDGVVPEAEGWVTPGSSVVETRIVDGEALPDVAESIVRLVVRSGEPVLCDRAVDDPVVGSDAVVRRRQIRSLLCLPLVNQGQLQGILYFENNQVDGAFVPERFRLLQLISSQAASALEKARLLRSQQDLLAAQHKFVPVQFLQTLGHSNLFEVVKGEGVVRRIDILFTDIRGFTTLMEPMAHGEAIEFLNDYLGHMEPWVKEHGGFVTALGGDSILALFDHEIGHAGLRAALAMARAERADNERRERAGLPAVHTGFGLHSGDVMMGIVGGEDTLRATIVGDAVNLASRVQDLTKRYRTTMLVTEATAEQLADHDGVTLRPLEFVRVVGRTGTNRIYEVLEALDPELERARRGTLELFLQGADAFSIGDLGTARRRFGEVVETDPTDAPTQRMVAVCDELIDRGVTADGPPITQLESK